MRAPSKSCDQSLPGTSVMLAEQAFVGPRVRNRIDAVGAQRHEGRAAPQLAFALRRLAREGLLRRRAPARRRHRSTDTSTQAGFFGVQMVAPRSISACAKSPARRGGSSDAASALMRGFAAGNSSSTANSRVTTRSTLPSTGTAGASKAIAAIAAAV